MPSAPDPREALIIQDALAVLNGEPPQLFNWPGTPWTHLTAAFAWLFQTADSSFLARLMRVASLLFGASCLFWMYRLGLRLCNYALLAPLLLALAPAFSAGEANAALVDMPAQAFGLAAAFCAFSSKRRSTKRALAVGALIGFGMAFKWTACVYAVPAAALLLQEDAPWRAKARTLLTAAGGGLLALLVGCPYLLVDFPRVWEAMQYEWAHYQAGHFGLFPTAEDNLLSAPLRHVEAFSWAAGPGLAAALIGCFTAASLALRTAQTPLEKEKKRERIALLIWAVAAAAAVASRHFSFTRHWLHVLPPLALLAASFFNSKKRRTAWAALGLAAAHTLLLTAALETQMRRPSTLDACADWIAENAPAASHGPSEPTLIWIYPPGLAADSDAETYVVALPEAELCRAVWETPGRYREADFFPLTRAHFTAGEFYARLMQEDGWREAARFAVDLPAWVRAFLFFGREPPFPLNALFHPELRIYIQDEARGRS